MVADLNGGVVFALAEWLEGIDSLAAAPER